MAKGRMLQKRISNSRKMANLSSDTVRLLYTWMLSHLDINGCFYADPVMVNNIVFTRLQKPIKTIEAALDELEANGLIIRYESGCEKYLKYPDFEEKQPSLQPSREGQPDIPPPTDEQLQSSSAVTPEKLHSNIKEIKRKEEKVKHLDAVLLTPTQHEALVKRYGNDLVAKAIEILNQYIMSKGKQYKSHYHTILGWPIEKAMEVGKGGSYQRLDKFGKPAPRQKWEDEAERLAREYQQRKAAKNAADSQTGKEPG